MREGRVCGQIFAKRRSGGGLDSFQGRAQPGDSPCLAEHGYHLVNPRTDRAAREGHAHWLRELSELQPEPLQHSLERGLDTRLVEVALDRFNLLRDRLERL